MARKQHRRHKTKRRQRGAGYFDDPKNMVTAGYIAHVPYGGAAMGNGPKDCTGNPMSHRPGWIDNLKAVGLPGMKGGSRKQRKRRGGAAYPNAATLAGAVINPVPETMKAELAQNMPGAKMSMPGVPTPAGAQVAQKGGRYMAGPFGPVGGPNGIGASPIGAQSIPCEKGYVNPLNPHFSMTNPNAKGPGPLFTGGALGGAPVSGLDSGYSAANFPRVNVGAVDMMKYEAPNAGYGHRFQTFPAPSAVGGLMLNTPYNAKEFNQACIKTGGGRRSQRKRGGANPVGWNAGDIKPLTIGQVGNRMDFDGTTKGLPVKFGGSRKRRTQRKRSQRKRSQRR